MNLDIYIKFTWAYRASAALVYRDSILEVYVAGDIGHITEIMPVPTFAIIPFTALIQIIFLSR